MSLITFTVVGLSLRRRTTLLAVAMTVAMTVAVAVLVEQHETDDVDNEAGNADVQHPVGVLDLVLVRQSLDSFHEDRETQSDEKDRVDEGSKHFRTSPAVRVLMRVHLRYLTQSKRQHIIV